MKLLSDILKETPFYTNKEGFNWHILQDESKYCLERACEDFPALNAVVFVVSKNNQPLSRVLIDKDTNEVLYECPDLESMVTKIDVLRHLKKLK